MELKQSSCSASCRFTILCCTRCSRLLSYQHHSVISNTRPMGWITTAVVMMNLYWTYINHDYFCFQDPSWECEWTLEWIRTPPAPSAHSRVSSYPPLYILTFSKPVGLAQKAQAPVQDSGVDSVWLSILQLQKFDMFKVFSPRRQKHQYQMVNYEIK